MDQAVFGERTKTTHPICLYCDTFLVLTIKRVAEKANGKVRGGCYHSIPDDPQISFDACNFIAEPAYCDSVRKTGIVFVFVKFYSFFSKGNVTRSSKKP